MSEDAEPADRLAALEQRLARLEAQTAAGEAGGEPAGDAGSPPGTNAAPEGRLWALEALRERVDDAGAVIFAGIVELPDGQHLEWQWGRGTHDLLAEDWQPAAETLSALAHPVRLVLLQQVLGGTRSAAELAQHEALGTSGQVYHHLRQLVAAGWLAQRARGEYVVPGERVVPLLVVLSAVVR